MKHSLTVIVCVAGWLISGPVWAAGETYILPVSAGAINSSFDINQTNIQQIARSITVKVFAGDTSGSGILIQKQGGIYSVVTNDHVLAAGSVYRIQTPDNRIYSATIQTRYKSSFQGNDLGVLQFSSNVSYNIASLTAYSTLQEGSEVFAAGFPIEDNFVGFKFTVGKITLLPEKALEQGYQIGYSNDIQKGMSGGPVLNRQGQVVGINGMHAYPLWGDPYVFKDGSLPCPKMRAVMEQSSWAIPIETFAKLAGFSVIAAADNVRHRSSFYCGNSPPIKPEIRPVLIDPIQPILPFFQQPLW